MTINGVQGGMSREGWSFKCLSRGGGGGVRRHNISLSRGAFIYCPRGGVGGYVCNYCHL